VKWLKSGQHLFTTCDKFF